MVTVGSGPGAEGRAVGRGDPRTPVRRLPLEAGEVSCPQRGVLAARRCLACSWFVGAELEGPNPVIRCAFWRALVVDRPGSLGVRLAQAWRPEPRDEGRPQG
jgi:hypothetical protein